jgi:glycosyltransferase involved in cell wall biosynthesis
MRRSPHVLLLNWRDTRHPEGGGSERYVERIAEELVGRGYLVTVQCAAHDLAGPGDWQAGVRFRRRGNKFTVYLHALVAIVLIRPDLIVDVQNGMPFCSRLVARCPVVVLVHHVHREQWRSALGPVGGRIGWWIESVLAPLIYAKCRYVTVSEVTRGELDELGVSRDRCTVIHNGLDAPPRTTEPRAADPTLVAVSRLVPHKRLEHAIDVVAALAHRWPTLRLELVGDGPWLEPLRAHIRRRGVADRVVLHGWVDEPTKHRILARSWVHLCPSVKEGWGIAIVEAAAHGVPSVAYRDAGGVTESIVDSVTGLLAEDFADLVTHVDKLLCDAELRGALGEACRHRTETFDWAHSASAFERLVLDAGGLTEPARFTELRQVVR